MICWASNQHVLMCQFLHNIILCLGLYNSWCEQSQKVCHEIGDQIKICPSPLFNFTLYRGPQGGGGEEALAPPPGRSKLVCFYNFLRKMKFCPPLQKSMRTSMSLERISPISNAWSQKLWKLLNAGKAIFPTFTVFFPSWWKSLN